MFSKFPSFPFSITKCDIGGGAWKRVKQKAALKGGGAQHRGGGGGFRVMVHKSLIARSVTIPIAASQTHELGRDPRRYGTYADLQHPGAPRPVHSGILHVMVASCLYFRIGDPFCV